MAISKASTSSITNGLVKSKVLKTDPVLPVRTGLIMWYDASNTANITLSGSSVTQWNDLSGNGRHASGGSSPQYVENALNGRAAVDFGTAGENWVEREARLQDTKNRQNSIETEDIGLQETWKTQQSYVTYAAEKAYRWAIDNGIAKEQARAVLPEGLTVSRLYMNGTLRSWVHYIQLRSANGTQKEHMEVAKECGNVIAEVFPMIKEFIA